MRGCIKWFGRLHPTRIIVLTCVLGSMACQKGEPFDDTPPESLRPIAQWGEPGAPPEEQFGSILAFAADSSGTVYIVDSMTQTVSAIDFRGHVLWKAGRSGDGPGEFRRVEQAVEAYGRVFLSDGYASRMTVLSSEDGRVLRLQQYAHQNMGAFMNGAMRALSPDVVVFGTMKILNKADSVYPFSPAEQQYMEHLDVLTGDQRSLAVKARQELYVYEPRDGSGEKATYLLPFAPWFTWTPNPYGGITTAWGGTYTISAVDSVGDTVRVIHRAVPPRRETADGVARARWWNMQSLERRIGAARVAKLPLPTRQPELTALYYSRDGKTLWVRRSQLDSKPVYDVFNSAGYACTVQLEVPGATSYNAIVHAQIVGGRVFHQFSDLKYGIVFIAAFAIPQNCGG